MTNNNNVIILENIKFHEFKSIFEPAKKLNNKITFKIDMHKLLMYGVSGGFDKFKFWSSDLMNICGNIQAFPDFDKHKQLKVVVLDMNNLFNTMSVLEDGMNLSFHVVLVDNVYEVKFITISKDTISIKFACASIHIGDDDMPEETKQSHLSCFGDTYNFKLSTDNLAKIKRLSNIQTLDTMVQNIIFGSKNGNLYIHNEVFDFEFTDITVGNMPDYKFMTAVFGVIDNLEYDVTITGTASGINKIIMKSTTRDVIFVCSLLVEVSDATADIEAQFAEFAMK